MTNWPLATSSHISDVRPLPDGSGFMFCVADSLHRIDIYSATTHSYSTLQETPNREFLYLSPDLSVGAGQGHSRENEIEIWSIEQGVKLTTFFIGDSLSTIVQLQFSADSRNIIALYRSSGHYYTAVHEAATGILLRAVPLLPSHTFVLFVNALFLSDDGSVVGGYTYDKDTDKYFAEAWFIHTGEHVVHSIPRPAYTAVDRYPRLALSSNFYGYITQDGKPAILDLASGISRNIPFLGRATYITLQDNGDILAVAGGMETSLQLVLFDTKTLARKTSFSISNYPITGVSVLPDASMAAVAHVSTQICEGPNGTDDYEYTTLALYESAASTIVRTLPQDGHLAAVQALAWSPDGSTVASTGTDHYTIWYEAATGKSLGRLPGIGALAFTQDGHSLLRASAGILADIDLSTAQITRTTSLPLVNIRSLIRSVDGSQFAVCGTDTIVLVRYPDMQQQIIALPVGRTLLSTVLTNNGVTGILVPTTVNDSFSIGTWNTNGVLVSLKTYSNLDGIISQAELSPDSRYVALWSGNRGRIISIDGETVQTFTIRISLNYDSEFSADGEQLLVSYADWLSEDYTPLQRVQRYWTSKDKIDDIVATVVRPSFSTVIGQLTISPKTDAFLFTPVQSCGIGTLYCRDITNSSSLRISSRALDFGDVYAGNPSVQTLTLNNDSEAPLIVEKFMISAGQQSKLFTLQYDAPLPDTLYGGDTRSVRVTCTLFHSSPIHVENRIGQLEVTYNDGALHTTNIVTIPFFGSITNPSMSMSTDTLDFGDVQIGTTEQRTIVISSLNPAPLDINKVEIDYPTTRQFSATTDQEIPVSLVRGEELTVTVSCHPSRQGKISSNLDIYSNDINTIGSLRRIYVIARGVNTVHINDYPTPQNNELNIFPNPVSSTAVIHYTMSQPGLARIDLFSVDGTLLHSVSNEQRETGNFSMEFPGKMITSGVYYCRLTTPTGTITKPVLILR